MSNLLFGAKRLLRTLGVGGMLVGGGTTEIVQPAAAQPAPEPTHQPAPAPVPAPAAKPAPQLWFAPLDQLPRDFLKGSGGSSDFMSLFQPDAPWGTVAAQVKVFKIYTHFALTAPEDDLRRVIADLKRRGIKLALETQFLVPGGTCGRGAVEGYSEIERTTQAFARIRDAGGVLDYVAMDEPLFYGHVSRQRNACNTPLPELAADVAKHVALVRSFFPHVVVGDIEPLSGFDPATVHDDVSAWLDAYEHATGEKLGFLHADLNFSTPWHGNVDAVLPALHRSGVSFGVIFNGETRLSDSEQAASLLQHAADVEGGDRAAPDQVLFQSWVRTPGKVLPETDPTSFTGVIHRYLQGRPEIVLDRAGGLSGQLLNARREPLAGATVMLEERRIDGPGAYGPVVIDDVAPANSAAALMAVRINTECHCLGRADIAFRDISLRDPATGHDYLDGASLLDPKSWRPAGSARTSFTPATTAAPPTLSIQADRSQTLQMNGAARFPIAAGTAYRLRYDLRASTSSDDSGMIGLIFLNAEGREVGRRMKPIQAAPFETHTAVTGPSGRFDFAAPTNVRAGDVAHVLRYGGDKDHAATRALVH